MKALHKYFSMFCTAGTLLFLGLDLADIPPRGMIIITGVACGVVNTLFYWFEKD